jgi:hypothetical protein
MLRLDCVSMWSGRFFLGGNRGLVAVMAVTISGAEEESPFLSLSLYL